MNVIIFSKRVGRARQFELSQRTLVGVVTVAVFLVIGAFLLGVGLSGSKFFGPGSQLAEWSLQLTQQRDQVMAARAQLQEKLDAFASRVGLMSAQVIRLDALGKRLTEMADLDKGEFDFEHPPAQGGPEGTFEGTMVGAPDLTSMLDTLAAQLKDRERQLVVLESLLSTRNLGKQLLPGGRPVEKGWISSYFGSRADPFTGRAAFHKGLDFAGPEGSQVVAVATGVVTWSRDRFGYGRTVEITHANGYVTRYAHNERNLVKVGETVQKGQPVALIGSSGRSTGPHLHFEVLRNGQSVNPMAFVGR